MNREDSKWWSAGFTSEWWDSLTMGEREQVLESMSDDEVEDLFTDWRVWGRDNQVPPDTNWRTWLICAGRGFGKLVDVETPIPTPSGWTRLGDLSVGDQVFDEAGRPCKIEKVFDGIPEVAYRLHFSDGTFIDACSEHQWVTWTHADRKAYLRSQHVPDKTRFPGNWPEWRAPAMRGVKGANIGYLEIRPDSLGPRMRTTQEIVDTFTHSTRGDTNHCIPTCRALDLPFMPLEVPPYVLGYWLGNGGVNEGTIWSDSRDIDAVRRELTAEGYKWNPRKDPIATGILGLRPELRALGVLGKKHIPKHYLRASAEQRLALLQGLMDSDGYAAASSVEFCSTTIDLAEGVMELARSLGQKPVLSVGRATLYGKDCGPKYRVMMRPTIPLFRVPRKASLVGSTTGQALRNHHRMIVKWEKIEPKPMRCLTVDAPNSMFLCGEGMIPTHNTRSAVEFIIGEVEKGFVKRIAIVGQGQDDIRSVMIEGDSAFLACSKPGNIPKWQPSVGGGRLIWPNKAVASIYSAEDTESLRGPQFHLAWFDEPMAVPAEKRERALSNLRFGLRLPVPGSRPRLILSTTPKKHSWMRQMLTDAGNPKKKIALTRGSTYDNAANLADDFLEMVIEDYEGTRLGKQEIHGELLGDDENAIWADGLLERQRKLCPETDDGEWPTQLLQSFVRESDRSVIGVDPNIKASGKDSKGKSTAKAAHAAGIVVMCAKGKDRFVVADRSTSGGPSKWGRAAVLAAMEFGVKEIVAEINQGGEMVKMVIQQAAADLEYPVKVTTVHATRGKQRRAEPVASAYERGRVFHMGRRGTTKAPGPFYKLEEQMMNLHEAYDPTGEDFDRCDAAVWGLTRLKLGRASSRGKTMTTGGIMTFSDFGR